MRWKFALSDAQYFHHRLKLFGPLVDISILDASKRVLLRKGLVRGSPKVVGTRVSVASLLFCRISCRIVLASRKQTRFFSQPPASVVEGLTIVMNDLSSSAEVSAHFARKLPWLQGSMPSRSGTCHPIQFHTVTYERCKILSAQSIETLALISEVCLQIADVLPGRLIFAAVKSYALFKRSKQAAQCVCFSIDDDLVRTPSP